MSARARRSNTAASSTPSILEANIASLKPIECLLLAQAVWELGASSAVTSWTPIAKILKEHPLLSSRTKKDKFFTASSCHVMYDHLMHEANIQLPADGVIPPHAASSLSLAEKHFKRRMDQLREMIAQEEAQFKNVFNEIQQIRTGAWQVSSVQFHAGPPSASQNALESSSHPQPTDPATPATAQAVVADDSVTAPEMETEVPPKSPSTEPPAAESETKKPVEPEEARMQEQATDSAVHVAAEPTDGASESVVSPDTMEVEASLAPFADAWVALPGSSPIAARRSVDEHQAATPEPIEAAQASDEARTAPETEGAEPAVRMSSPMIIDESGIAEQQRKLEVQNVTQEEDGTSESDRHRDAPAVSQPDAADDEQEKVELPTSEIPPDPEMAPASPQPAPLATQDEEGESSGDEPLQKTTLMTRLRDAQKSQSVRDSRTPMSTTTTPELPAHDMPQPGDESTTVDSNDQDNTHSSEKKRKASVEAESRDKKRLREASEGALDDEHDTASIRRRRNLPPDVQAAHKRFQAMIGPLHASIHEHRSGNIFHNPIRDSEAPDYSLIVKRPMDLKKIKNKIRDGVITNSLEYQRDIYLMFANALMYNQPGSDVYTMTKSMMSECEESIETFRQTEGFNRGSSTRT